VHDLRLLLCMQPLLVAADVVPVTLDVSDEELLFTFSLDNWDDHVQQASVPGW
jgi:hypothetical protein